MGTINITGTGGIIEGNLGAANVNVNLDSNFKSVDSTNNQQILGASIANLGNQTNYTVMAWIKQSAGQSDSGGTVVLNGNNFDLDVNDTGYVRFAVRPAGSYIDVSTSGSYGTAWTKATDGWHHVCGRWDSGTGGGTLKIFIDGNEIATRASVGTSATTAGTTALKMFTKDTNHDDQFAGEIIDVKCFNSVVSDADIKILASKINTDPALTSSASNCQVWYKLNDVTETTPQDSSGNTNHGPTGGISTKGSALTKVYDNFSVDVYDNSTTTDGTFTVTQGKVEGKALTSIDFDGTNDLVSTSNASDLSFGDGSSDSAFSISAWIRPDDVDRFRAVTKSNDTQTEYILGTNSASKAAFHLYDETTSHQIGMPSLTTIPTNVWTHITGTYSGGGSAGLNIYVNGVNDNGTQASLGSYTAMHNTDGNMEIGRWRDTSTFADGEIRDVKIFDYELGAEQVASLYSGTYPQTPHHYYKLDEGSGTTATDSGTTTQRDGFVSGATYSNGTLDLDDELIIEANGILSAPRGTLSLEDHFENNSSVETNVSGVFGYQHNNGLLFFPNTSNQTILLRGSRSTVLYNLTSEETGYHAPNITTNLFIERDWTNRHSQINGGVTVTMGTDSYASTIQCNSGNGLDFTNNTSSAAILKAKNSLYPVTITGETGGGVDFDKGGSGSQVELADVNYVDTLTTGGNGVTIKLTGDCEFDAVTVSSGDTLDLSGQRMFTSGLVTISGDNGLKNTTDGSTQDTVAHLITNGIIASTTTHHASLSNVVYIADNGVNTHKIEYFDFGTFVSTRDGHVNFGRFGPDSSSINVILANNGTMQNWGRTGSGANANLMNNLTIATGTSAVPESSTLTVAGDFTTSGGLIGKSAVVFDHDTSEIITSTLASAPSTAITLEAWVKSDDVTQYQTIITDRSQSVHLAIYNSKLYIWTDTDASARVNVSGVTTLTNNKWHHLAMTWDAATDIMSGYVDGKLEISASSVGNNLGSISTAYGVGRREDVASQAFDGVIAMTRIFNVGRTQAQLRTDMFNDFDSMSSTTGLLQMFQFDEGTGTSVDDVSANSNTGTITGASFAGAGTFTHGTSTLTMSGSNKFINYGGGVEDIYNLNITGTITLNDIDGGGSSFRINGNTFTCGAGATLSSDTTEVLRFMNNMDGGTVTFADPTANVVGLDKIFNDMSSPRSLNIPEMTAFFFRNNGTGTTVATGNHTFTQELEINSGTYNANGNTIASRIVDVNAGTLDLRNSTLNFSVSSSSDQLNMNSDSIMLSGNTTINGHSSASKTLCATSDNAAIEVVGTVKHLVLDAEADLTVIGAVIDCDVSATGANIRQWHHTLDTQQLLDADEAGDDDLRLTKPALDNALELQTR